MLFKRLSYLFSSGASNTKFVYEPVSKVATITLSNPSKRNTLSLETLTQINSHLDQVNTLKDARSLFIKSQGVVFSSGHDLKQLTDAQKAKQVFKLAGDICQRFRILNLPVVSVVNGLVAAAGLQLVASTDLVIATNKSTFSTPGVKWGIFCTTPGVALIRSFSSEKKALEMLLLGESITAEQAYKFGLVSKLVNETDLDIEVQKYIDGFNHMSQEVLTLGKKAFYEQKSKNLETAYDIGVQTMCQNVATTDGHQGLKAFAQKRHPKWKK